MSVSLLAPDLRRILTDLATRIGNLEKRVNPTAVVRFATTIAHIGTGANSVVVEPPGSDAVASGDESIAIGPNGPSATAPGALAVGNGAEASGTNATVLGAGSVIADGGTAIGWGTAVAHAHSSAFGTQASTTRTHQVVLGDATDFVEIPGDGIVLTSPDGTRYLVVVNNGGSLSSSPAA